MAQVDVMRKVLASNDALATQQLRELDRHGVLSVNLMSGPGAGKTSLVERTIERLAERLRIYVIEGDVQGTLDAERVAAHGVPVTQVNTQGACHLDGFMLSAVFSELDLKGVDLLIIENVGNLVCPAEFKLPTHYSATIVSTPEGSDKPLKYPLMFTKSDVVVINKVDLLPYVDFDCEGLAEAVHKLKPGIPVLRLSTKTGEGVEEWTRWIEERLANRGVETTRSNRGGAA